MKHRQILTSVILSLGLVAFWALSSSAQCCGSQRKDNGEQSPVSQSGNPRIYQITVTEQGFVPAQVTLKAGQPARLVFRRKTDRTCATEVIIPGLAEQKTVLPLNKDVTLDILPAKAGGYQFMCPMKMIKGDILVK